MKNKGTAILLAVFLGGLGIYQYYLNNPGRGLIYTLFCRTLVPSIIAILDICKRIGVIYVSVKSSYKKRYSIYK